MKKLIVLLAILATSGCSALTTTEFVLSEVVSDYCKAPESGRALIQRRVHRVLEPNTIKIVCASDQQ
jgi:hypothetical protein